MHDFPRSSLPPEGRDHSLGTQVLFPAAPLFSGLKALILQRASEGLVFLQFFWRRPADLALALQL